MSEVQYKAAWGVLHIGRGRFFHANEPVEVDDSQELLAKFKDLKAVETDEPDPDPDGNDGDGSGESGDDPEAEPEIYTESSLKKLSADEQKAIIEDLGGNVEETSNQDDRIALILQLQEDGQKEGE